MAEYIEREALIADIEKRYCKPCEAEGKDYNHIRCRACWVDDMVGEIGDFPHTDVAPVRHARWVRGVLRGGMLPHRCSECKNDCQVPTIVGKPIYNYCPNCGAQMDLEVSE